MLTKVCNHQLLQSLWSCNYKQFRTRNLRTSIATRQLLILINKKLILVKHKQISLLIIYYFLYNFTPEILYFSLERNVFLLQVARPQRNLIFLDPSRLPRSLRSHVVLPSSVPIFHILFKQFHCRSVYWIL